MKVELTKLEIDIALELMSAGVKMFGMNAVTPETLSIRAKFLKAQSEVAQATVPQATENTLDG